MALYAVGDVQGCRDSFLGLLGESGFDRNRDHLVLVGDLVNRGPDSAGVVREVMALGDAASCVLGNHDLNALAVAIGARPLKPRDTMADLIDAADGSELLEWLRSRPLLVEREGYLFCHAGIYPRWSLETARGAAREVESALRGADHGEFLARMYGSEPDTWDGALAGYDRLRFITTAFTRMRYVSATGSLDHLDTGPPGTQRHGLVPWFDAPGRRPLDAQVVFGHWSSLGYYRGADVIGLDSGCVWGRYLTAVRLDGRDVTAWQVECRVD